MTETNAGIRQPQDEDVWNDSLTGDYLWSNVNFGEAVSDVMTPLTWSLLQTWRQQWPTMRGVPPFGNVGGRLYLNVSYFASALAATGKSEREIHAALEDTLHMPIPAGIQIPVIPVSKAETLVFMVKSAREQMRWARIARTLSAFVASNPTWCRDMRRAVEGTTAKNALARLWESEIRSRSIQAYLGVLSSAMRFSSLAGPVRQELTRLVGADQADVLISNLSGDDELLASLGPLVGLDQVARGKMTPEEYLEGYGHRGPNEWEVSTPRPAEDPAWLEAKLAEYRHSPVDVEALLARQRRKFEDAWLQLQQRHPGEARRIRRQIDEIARRGRLREAARSEMVRVIWIVRNWALRAGTLTELRQDLFFLSIDELLRFLSGSPASIQQIPARRRAYSRYRALPPYPAVINGPFDPFHWAADPGRSNEIFDAHAPASSATPESDTITGSAGSAGRVEGLVRVLDSLEHGHELRTGEILVTTLTDIGWTPLFPRAAAVVTDVGAALSHAAIVARELGIPAVVGCGNATRRLKTGDRVVVDGGQGIIRVLESTVTQASGSQEEVQSHERPTNQ
jgi:phosphohistidine swiveling domain-containing protein